MLLEYHYLSISPIFMSIYIMVVLHVCMYRHNILKVLMSFELVLVLILVDFSFTSYFFDDSFGVIVALFLFVLAGSETALGLAMIVSFHRNINRVDVEFFTELNG